MMILDESGKHIHFCKKCDTDWWHSINHLLIPIICRRSQIVRFTRWSPWPSRGATSISMVDMHPLWITYTPVSWYSQGGRHSELTTGHHEASRAKWTKSLVQLSDTMAVFVDFNRPGEVASLRSRGGIRWHNIPKGKVRIMRRRLQRLGRCAGKFVTKKWFRGAAVSG